MSNPETKPKTNFITTQNLSWQLPNGEILFKNLSFSFGKEKTGFVGKNGIGKTTLIRLLIGELSPLNGTVHINCKLAYLPQNFTFLPEATIAATLGINTKLKALKNITNGSINSKDFEILNDDWDIEAKTQQQLTKLGLEYLNLERQMKTLSGGETTRVILANLLLQNPDYLILDEPTNNLDHESRKALYKIISEFTGGILVISHDRQLLALVDQIMELSAHGLKFYGGNYDLYLDQKKLEQEAAEQQLKDAKKVLRKTKIEIQKSQEKLQQREKQGNKLRKDGSQSKLLLDKAKDNSEQTAKHLAIKAEKMLENSENNFATAKTKIITEKVLNINLAATNVPKAKLVIEIKDLVFTYSNAAKPIINNLNYQLFGPKHVAIRGKNGSGKTTLLRLIANKLLPTQGTIKIGVTFTAYLDQKAELLNRDQTILDNFKTYNPDLTENECYSRLAQFLFRNEAARKKVVNLSGGEKLRAALACILMAKNPPQLLLLDEPTNHMDLESIRSIETALKNYQGAIMVISHDTIFLENIGIDEYLEM